MTPDPDRIVAALSALAGGVFLGMHNLATALLGGRTVGQGDVVRAVLNVGMAAFGGMLAAYFLGTALAPLIPLPSLRDLHAVGFAIGAGSWELAPFVLGWAKAWSAKKVKAEEAP